MKRDVLEVVYSVRIVRALAYSVERGQCEVKPLIFKREVIL